METRLANTLYAIRSGNRVTEGAVLAAIERGYIRLTGRGRYTLTDAGKAAWGRHCDVPTRIKLRLAPTPLNADEKELLGAEFTLHGEPGFVWSLGERGMVWARFSEGFRQLDASEVRAAVARYLLDC